MQRPFATIERLQAGGGVTLAALGDSLTYGWIVSKGYLDFLGEMLREKYPKARLSIVGSGIPGDTADSGLFRVQEKILDERPDCVLVEYAINDAECGYTVPEFARSIQAIIDRIRGAGDADIVLVTSVHVDDRQRAELLDPFYRELEELGETNGLPVARVHAYWRERIGGGVEHLSLVQADGVHPTVAGYRLMAEAIMMLF